MRDQTCVEIKVMEEDTITELTSWIMELGMFIPQPSRSGDVRLSGKGDSEQYLLRDSARQPVVVCYSRKKNGIVTQLTVM